MRGYYPFPVQEMSNDTTDSSSSDESETTKSTSDKTTEIDTESSSATETSPDDDTTSSENTTTTTHLRGVTGTRQSARLIAQKVQRDNPRTRTARVPIPKKKTNSVPKKITSRRIPAYTRKRKPGTTSSDSDDSSSSPRWKRTTGFSHNVGQRRARKASSTTDSDDSSFSRPCRKAARVSQSVGQRRARNASFCDSDRSGRRNIRRTYPSTSMPMPRESSSDDSDETGFEVVDEAEFRKKKPFSKARPSRNEVVDEAEFRKKKPFSKARPSRNEVVDEAEFRKKKPFSKARPSRNEVVDEAEFRKKKPFSKARPSRNEVVDEAEFRKKKPFSKARPSRNKYDKYKDYADEVEEVDVNEFMFHSKSNIGTSTMKQPYRGGRYEDTEWDEMPFARRDRVDIAPAKESFIRKNVGLDEASSAHVRRNKMSGESVNDNIVARQVEELSSGIASLTRLKMMSEKKTADVIKPAVDLSDELPSLPSDSGYDSSGRDDPAVIFAYVSDISDSRSTYSEKYDGIERNSNTHVSISMDDEPKECEKQKVPSSRENAEKAYEISKTPQDNEETNTTLADKEEGLQVNSHGERKGSSLKHVSNEHRNREEVKEGDEAVVEKLNVPLRKEQNGEKACELNKVRANDVTNEKLHVKNNITRKESTTAPYSNTSPVTKGANRPLFKNQSLSDRLNQAKAVYPALPGERLQVKSDIGNKSPAAPCSSQSPLGKKSSEAGGMNSLLSPNQSRSERLTQTNAGSLEVAEDKGTGYLAQKKINEANLGCEVNEETVATEGDCDYTDNGVRRKTDECIAEDRDISAADKFGKRRKLTSSRLVDLFKTLGDMVLERSPPIQFESEDESAQAPTNKPRVTLPLKFRFEDAIPRKAEKTEFEVMLADLFEELNSALEKEQSSSIFSDVNLENECSPTEETRDARCARGLHELELVDDEGLYCIYCRHVELEARDILPQWVESTCRKQVRKRLAADTEDFPGFDEPHVESPVKIDTVFNSTDDGTVWNVKPRVRESMYKHQQEGFEFLWKNLAGGTNLADLKNPNPDEVGGCIISHAPGTGKTRLTIVFIETYLRVFPDCRPIIIAPASMLLTWAEEFEKWDFPFPFHNLNDIESGENKDIPKQFGGPGSQDTDTIRMLKIFIWNKGGSILGLSYSLFARLTGEKQDDKNKKSQAKKQLKDKNIKQSEMKLSDERIEMLRKILLEKPGLVILDEGHTPRNQSSNIWNALLKLKTEKRVILSGTPFQNNFGELFNTLQLVRPSAANVIAKDKAFTVTSRRGKKRPHDQSGPVPEVIDGVMLEKLKSIMSPFVNVHKGTILRESLPGLRDSVILLKPQNLQASLIRTLEGNQCTFEFEHKVALISVHPYLLKYCGSWKKENLDADFNLVEASKLNPNEGVKTKFIIELLRLSIVANEKVLIFGQYIQPLELIKEQLKEVFKWVEGRQILQMKGKQNQKIRQQLMKLYNNPLSEARVMLASTKCCSEGISLVGASRVILLDVVWNPSVERQAICRAYRIGQKKFVYTYHLMTSGTTEGDKYCRQAEKERLSELVFCSSYGESDKKKNPTAGGIEDKILEKMVGSAKLKDMFEKILNQPKETDLIQTFGLDI